MKNLKQLWRPVRFLISLRSSLIIFLFICSSPQFIISQSFFRKNEYQNSARQQLKHKLEQYLTDYYQAKNIASITAGVSEKGKIFWISSRGYADLSNRVYAQPNTIYRIASISKIITAVAIMQLVEKKKINLDDDARKYMPYFPKKRWKFTVRQILQHTSGIRTYKTGEFNSTVGYATTRNAVDVISKDSLQYKPGTKYLYSTLAYNVLAAIIENVSGLPFDEYLRKNIFEVCDMKNTNLEFQKEIVLNEAKGYEKNLYRKIQNAPLADLSIKYAGGGIISDAEDILKFADGLMRGKLIHRASLDTMLVPARLANGTVLNSGLGFELGKSQSGQFFFGHYGHGTGFVSLLAIFPSDSIASLHLINTVDRNIDSPALDLASIILNKASKQPLKSLADKMMEITLNSNIDSAIVYYSTIKKDSSDFYNMTDKEFDLFGYDLLRIKKHNEAIKWFRFFAQEYPKDISAFIGLGDSYYNDNNIGLALKSFRRVLAMDVYNKYAIKMIRLLENR